MISCWVVHCNLILFCFKFKLFFSSNPLSPNLRNHSWGQISSGVICLAYTHSESWVYYPSYASASKYRHLDSDRRFIPRNFIRKQFVLIIFKPTCYYYYLRIIFHSSRGFKKSRNNHILAPKQTNLGRVIIKKVQGKFNFRI